MNSDFSISVDDQAIATITWDCEKKSMNVLSFEALETLEKLIDQVINCLLYTSPSPRDRQKSRMPSSA